jgi:hypothetical protein
MAAGIWGIPLRIKQMVTPSNPASGSNALYFKSDSRLYSLDSSGIETKYATTSEAAGPIALPYIERSLSSGQAIASGTSDTTVLWSQSVVAGSGNLSYSSGTFTTGTAGLYLVTVSVAFNANSTGKREVTIRQNGTGKGGMNVAAPNSAAAALNASALIICAANDSITVDVNQNSGSSLNVQTNSRIVITRIGTN